MSPSYESGQNLRRPRNVAFLLCAGETEKTYFNGFRDRENPLPIDVRVTTDTDPLSMVQSAKGWINKKELDIPGGDKFWCIFDIDENKPSNLEKANSLAKKLGVKLCPSNPCFEYWLLLHFRFSEGIHTPTEMDEELKKYIPGYEKGENYCDIFMKKLPTALQNSKKLVKQSPNTYVRNVLEDLDLI